MRELLATPIAEVFQRLEAERLAFQHEQVQRLAAGDTLPLEQALRLHALSEICGDHVLRMTPAPTAEQMQQMAKQAGMPGDAKERELGAFGDRHARPHADGCSLLTIRFPPGSKVLEWMQEQIHPHMDLAEFALLCIAEVRRQRLTAQPIQEVTRSSGQREGEG